MAADEAVRLRARDELVDRVRPELEALGELADRGRAVGRAGGGEKELVLLRLEARLARRLLGEAQEATDAIAELGQGLEVGIGEISS